MLNRAIIALALWSAAASANEYQWFLFQELAEDPVMQPVSLDAPLDLQQTHLSEFEPAPAPALQPEHDGLEMVDYRNVPLFAPAKQELAYP